METPGDCVTSPFDELRGIVAFSNDLLDSFLSFSLQPRLETMFSVESRGNNDTFSRDPRGDFVVASVETPRDDNTFSAEECCDRVMFPLELRWDNMAFLVEALVDNVVFLFDVAKDETMLSFETVGEDITFWLEALVEEAFVCFDSPWVKAAISIDLREDVSPFCKEALDGVVVFSVEA